MESTTPQLQLSSLRNYALRQTQLIESISSRTDLFEDLNPNDDWMTLWHTFWDKQVGWDTKQKVERGPDPIDDSLILPDIVPAECDVMIKPDIVDGCWPLDSESIFIRSE
jgi:hypothetical protein